MRNKYTVIVCTNNKGAIGNNGKLLYHLKGDMANFKTLTTDNVVIMGRKTFESLPGMKPLNNRINIIITTNPDYKPAFNENSRPWTQEDINNTYFVNSLEEADELCYAYFSDKELFIIGGSQIYEQALDKDMVNKAIVTTVSDDTEGDSYFPHLSNDERYKIIFTTNSLRDRAANRYYKYTVYKRK